MLQQRSLEQNKVSAQNMLTRRFVTPSQLQSVVVASGSQSQRLCPQVRCRTSRLVCARVCASDSFRTCWHFPRPAVRSGFPSVRDPTALLPLLFVAITPQPASRLKMVEVSATGNHEQIEQF